MFINVYLQVTLLHKWFRADRTMIRPLVVVQHCMFQKNRFHHKHLPISGFYVASHSPPWTISKGYVKCDFCVKALPQCSHTCGFFPLCANKCFCFSKSSSHPLNSWWGHTRPPTVGTIVLFPCSFLSWIAIFFCDRNLVSQSWTRQWQWKGLISRKHVDLKDVLVETWGPERYIFSWGWCSGWK